MIGSGYTMPEVENFPLDFIEYTDEELDLKKGVTKWNKKTI